MLMEIKKESKVQHFHFLMTSILERGENDEESPRKLRNYFQVSFISFEKSKFPHPIKSGKDCVIKLISREPGFPSGRSLQESTFNWRHTVNHADRQKDL